MNPFLASMQALLQLTIDSLTSAPHLTPAQKATRTEAVTRAVMGFAPFEPVQMMLASQAVGHHMTLMDTFLEILGRAVPVAQSGRMRMVSVAQTKVILDLVQELRVVRREAMAALTAERAQMQDAADANAAPGPQTGSQPAQATAEAPAPVTKSQVAAPPPAASPGNAQSTAPAPMVLPSMTPARVAPSAPPVSAAQAGPGSNRISETVLPAARAVSPQAPAATASTGPEVKNQDQAVLADRMKQLQNQVARANGDMKEQVNKQLAPAGD